MSDRGFMFLFSLLMIVGSLAAVVWLVVTGQALTVDGLFLVISVLLVAAGFGLYLKFLIRRAMEPPAPPAKGGTASASRA
jgi:hypothetical protein